MLHLKPMSNLKEEEEFWCVETSALLKLFWLTRKPQPTISITSKDQTLPHVRAEGSSSELREERKNSEISLCWEGISAQDLNHQTGSKNITTKRIKFLKEYWKKSNKQLKWFSDLREETCINSSPPCTLGLRYPAPLLPVPITNVPELGANETSHERPNSASFHKGLCKGPNPDVNVFWCPIELQELPCQVLIPQHPTKWLHSSGLWEPTEFSPGVVTCK